MNLDFKLTRYFPFSISWSAFLIFPLYCYLLRSLDGIAAGLLFILGLALHEMGHATAAHFFKRVVMKITIQFFGGVCYYIPRPTQKREEMIIFSAGGLVGLMGAIVQYFVFPESLNSLWVYFFAANVLGALNLLPIMPLDGGQIFKMAIMNITRHYATIVIFISVVLTAAIIGVGLYLNQFTFAVFGILVLGGLVPYVSNYWNGNRNLTI